MYKTCDMQHSTRNLASPSETENIEAKGMNVLRCSLQVERVRICVRVLEFKAHSRRLFNLEGPTSIQDQCKSNMGRRAFATVCSSCALRPKYVQPSLAATRGRVQTDLAG